MLHLLAQAGDLPMDEQNIEAALASDGQSLTMDGNRRFRRMQTLTALTVAMLLI